MMLRKPIPSTYTTTSATSEERVQDSTIDTQKLNHFVIKEHSRISYLTVRIFLGHSCQHVIGRVGYCTGV